MTTTQAALDFLEANSGVCKTKANSAECKSNYYVMQAHHDHCPQEKLPREVKDELHEFEAFYEDCHIKRQFVSGLSSCPALASCSNALTTDKEIVTEMEDNTCNDDCSSNACKTRFQKMLMYHDTCDVDQVPTGFEQAVHKYEEKCEAHLCNTATALFTLDMSVCSSSAAPRVITSASKFVLGLAGFAAYFLM